MRKLFAVLVATLFIFAATLPAFAQAPARTVDFYGNLRMNTYLDKWSKEAAQNHAVPAKGNGLFSDSDLYFAFDTGNSRFGANFKQGDLFANVEIRPLNGNYIRQWYGTWDMKWAKLILGHTWTPTFLGGSGCCFDGGLAGGYGPVPNSLRSPEIGLDIPVGVGRLWIAALTHDPNPRVPSVVATAATMDTDVKLPRLELRFDQTFGPVTLNVVGGYSSFQEVRFATDAEYDLTAWLAGAKLTFAQGPLTVNGQIWKGQNLPQYGGISGNYLSFGAFYNAATDQIIDSDSIGWGADALFKFTDMISVGAGYWGFKNTRQRPAPAFEENDKDAYYYIYAPINVTKNIQITPEIGKFDFKTITNSAGVTTNEGNRIYYGAYWFLSF